MTSVGGIGYQIVDPNEPDVTVRTFLGRTQVCIRRTPRWKESIAEFVLPEHAEFFAEAIRMGMVAIPKETT